MTNQFFSITPPPELAQTIWSELRNAHFEGIPDPKPWNNAIAKAYQAGADMELKACSEWVESEFWEGVTHAKDLRLIRRPKPLSEADQALNDLDQLSDIAKLSGVFNPPDTIRRALERLKELEEATND